MNNEHNIDDILKLLKEAVEKESVEEPSVELDKKKQPAKVIKCAPKKQAISESGESENLARDAYAFDEEFLKEFEAEASENPQTEDVEETIDVLDAFLEEYEDPQENEKTEEETFEFEEEIEDMLSPLSEEDEPTTEFMIFDEDGPAPWEEPEEEPDIENILAFEEDAEEEFSKNEVSSSSEAPIVAVIDREELELPQEMMVEESEEPETFHITEQVSYEETPSKPDEIETTMTEISNEFEADVPSDEEPGYEEFPEIETIAMPELIQDFSADESGEAMGDLSALSVEDFAESGDSADATAEFCVNESVYELMMQLGCQEELEEIPEDEVTEEFAEEDLSLSEDEDEYRRVEQEEEILSTYRRRSVHTLIRMISLGMLAVVVFLYDILPLFDVEFHGLIDYHTYLGSYLLIGIQLLFLGAVFLWKPMWTGIKRLFTLRPDFYSLIGVLLVYTVAYDLVMVLSNPEQLPPVFHFVCMLWMFLAVCAEMILIRRERKLFLTFSSRESKYTLDLSEGKHSIAEKMYQGGLEEGKRVYAPRSVAFPTGFFRLIRGENPMSARLIVWMMLPSVLLSLVAGMITMLLEENLTVVCLSAITTMFAMLPCSTVALVLFVVGPSSVRLGKRGIALTGNRAIGSYADTDIMVFHDLHLFKKCETQDTGMVIYEQKQAANILGCLQLLYSKIGGPMAKAFDHVPQSYRFHQIRIRRITRNGIEAIVAKKHVLIVGDAGFMQRYGFSFPMNEEWDGRATLCVSLDGRMSAKISAAYTLEPVFEMLIERLATQGVRCVIETYDPMISSAFIAEQRKLGVTPISVVHKNEGDLKKNGSRRSRKSETGILTLSSRLKLAEAVVWCKRFVKIWRRSNGMIATFSILGLMITGLLIGFGQISAVNQYWLLLFGLLPCLGILLISVFELPQKDYFTLEALKDELLRAAKVNTTKQQKANKGNK